MWQNAKDRRLRLILMIVAVVALVSASVYFAKAASRQPSSAVHVVGNRLLNDNGFPVKLIGVARPGLEYSCDGEGPYDITSFVSIRTWSANTVRIAVSSQYWLDTDHTCLNYQSTVANAIKQAEAAGLYVIVELHVDDPTETQMPHDDALQFWSQFLTKFRTDRYLIAELFNEPHDVSWSVWRDGGTVTTLEGSYHTPGMQKLIDLANATAPAIPLIVSGLGWEYDYTGTEEGYALHGNNLIYGVHIYDYAGKQPQDWANSFGFLEKSHPVVVTEFGDTAQCDGSWLRNTMPDMLAQTSGIVAWAWIPAPDDCHYPAIISNWQGTPSAYGQSIHDFFLANGQ